MAFTSRPSTRPAAKLRVSVIRYGPAPCAGTFERSAFHAVIALKACHRVHQRVGRVGSSGSPTHTITSSSAFVRSPTAGAPKTAAGRPVPEPNRARFYRDE